MKPYNVSEDKAALAAFKRLEKWSAASSDNIVDSVGLCRPETVTEYATKMWCCALQTAGGILDVEGVADTLESAIQKALDQIGAA